MDRGQGGATPSEISKKRMCEVQKHTFQTAEFCIFIIFCERSTEGTTGPATICIYKYNIYIYRYRI